jgi:hypothetical protein
MVNKKPIEQQERLSKFFHAVEEAQKFQDDLLKYGLEAVHLYVEDVEGDWLERWGDDEPDLESVEATAGLLSNLAVDLTTFLKSDDAVAMRVRQQLGDKSISNVAMELEDYLSISDQNERLFAVRNLLVGGENVGASADKFLAEDLLARLVEIFASQS